MNHRAFCYKCKQFTYFAGLPSEETMLCKKCGSAERFDDGVLECLDIAKEYRTLAGRAVKLEEQSLVSGDHDKVVGQIDGNYGCTYWDKDGYANGFMVEGGRDNLVEK